MDRIENALIRFLEASTMTFIYRISNHSKSRKSRKSQFSALIYV